MSIQAVKLARAIEYLSALDNVPSQIIHDLQEIEQAQKQEPVTNGKLKVTLQDTPTEIERAQYKRMFEAACSALGAIGEALGVDEDEGGAEPILAAITELKASPPQRQPLTDEQIIKKLFPAGFERNSLGWTFTYGRLDYHLLKFARAIEAAHSIKGEEC